MNLANDTWELRCGNCIDQKTGLASMADRSIDHIASDPPYGSRTHAGQRHGRRGGEYKDGWVSAEGLKYDHLTPRQVKAIGAEMARVTKGWILVMTSHDLFPSWEAALGRYTFAPLPIVLEGMNVRLAGDGPSSWTVWLVVNRPVGFIDGTKPGAYVGSPGAGPERASNPVKGHKPEWLMSRILRDYTKPGELVCDPFAGSGTTGVASLKTGRRFLGWELNAQHHRYAYQRLTAAREQLGLFGAA